MCAAAHAWVGLGRIVYASSSAQLRGWLDEWGVPPGPVLPLAINEVAPGIQVDGPVDELAAEVRDLKQGFAAVEERARAELGLIAPNETYFQVVPPEVRTSPPPDPVADPGPTALAATAH